MKPTRRDFLLGGASAAALLASTPLPAILGRAVHAAGSESPDGRILVMLQLTGGNDGLNTVVPYRDDDYRRLRPTLAVPANAVHRLDDELGLHPELESLRRLYDDGRLAVINNVGYPNPDRSHFRSMDVWHTADPVDETQRLGWIGSSLDQTRRRASGSTAPRALHLDDTALPLALVAEHHTVPSIRDTAAFRLDDSVARLRDAMSDPRPDASAELRFVQELAESSCANADRLSRLPRAASRGSYPDHPLGSRLRQVADLIAADFGPRIYYTSLQGFDTHSRQELVHGPLLRTLGDSVGAFLDDLTRRGLEKRVVVVTFSEFGRRVAENASMGTDHGAAAPMFVAGSACNPGVHGGAPDLAGLDAGGDVQFRIDFRQVYATLLDRVIGCDPDAVLGARFAPVDIIRRA